MGTRTLSYTYTGSETGSAVLATMALPAFTGNFTITATMSTTPTATHNVRYQFFRSSDSFVCRDVSSSFSAGENPDVLTGTVGTPSASWPATNFDQFRLLLSSSSWAGRAGATITVAVSGANVSDPNPCQYGTRPTSSAPAIAFVTDAAIAAACTLIGAPWLAVLFAPLIGYAIDTGALCGSGPPPMPVITNASLLDDISSRIAALQSTMWYSLCECVPGTPAPVPYPLPEPAQPVGWPPAQTYSCDPANLCATLTLILKRLDELSTTTIGTAQLVTLIQRYEVPFATVDGGVHAGLTGAGSFAVQRSVGFRVEITAGTPTRQLEGTPPYLWNAGWVSCSEGSRMLSEHRIAQEFREWLPQEAPLATVFSYWLYSGVTLRVTELRAEP